MSKINWWAILISVIAAYIFGAIWYNVFGAVWSEGWGLTGGTEEFFNSPTFLAGNIASFGATILFTIGFAYLAGLLDLQGIKPYLGLALFMAGVLVIPGIITNGVFVGTSVGAQLVDTFHVLLRLIIIALIVGAWQKKSIPARKGKRV